MPVSTAQGAPTPSRKPATARGKASARPGVIRRGGDAATPDDAALSPPALRWVNDGEPGWRRQGSGPTLQVTDAAGRRISDPAALDRVRKLAIPPAWTDVWICPDGQGHLQATGRDAKGRKQYRYHADWQTWRSQNKFEQLLAFARALPRLRAAVRKELDRAARHPGAPRRSAVIAALVHLLDTTRLRIGNEAYVRQNRSFGLSTLHNRHASTTGRTLVLRFVGKSGVRHEARIADLRLARLVQRCRDLPGQALFQYVDEDGSVRRIDASDVNAWLAEAAGPGVTAKVFRTWHGSACALERVIEACASDDPRPCARAVYETVAEALGNTPAVCRRSYIHPAVLRWAEAVGEAAHRQSVRDHRWPRVPAFARNLSAREQRLVAFLARAQAEAEAQASAPGGSPSPVRRSRARRSSAPSGA